MPCYKTVESEEIGDEEGDEWGQASLFNEGAE